MPYKVRIYDYIKNEIINGGYKAGDVMNERQLSEQLGISRTPVREALQLLAQDGWLIMETYKGAVVRKFEPQYIHNVMRIRIALEISAVEDAIRNARPEDIETLQKLADFQNDGTSSFTLKVWMQYDRDFHSCIYNLSGNTELARLLDNYNDIFWFLGGQAVTNNATRRLETIAEHRAIIDAFRKGSAEEAIRAMKQHLENTEKNVYLYTDIPT